MASPGTWLHRWFAGKKGAAPGPPPMAADIRPAAPASFAQEGNACAVAMYGPLRQQAGNICFSPFSIRMALGMALAGARGETASQMEAMLRIASSDEASHVEFDETMKRLNRGHDGKYELVVANSLWAQAGVPLQPEYRDLIARHYARGMNQVDFRHAGEAARAIINRWVEDTTRRKIRELIPPGGLSDLTRLVLANAVYFKGVWSQPFLEEATRDEPFFKEDGGTTPAPLMHERKYVRYGQAPGFQAVDLDYEGDDLSMLVLLPHRRQGLRDLEATLSERMLRQCVTRMERTTVEVFLPRFRITWGPVDMGGRLAALGMPLPFDQSRADFSGINGHLPPHQDALSLSAVYHQAFVEVSEKGTEASAATTLSVAVTSAMHSRPKPIPVFRADHPFLFAIRDRRDDAILFLGRVSDPECGH